jgi:hypothetical protein
LVIGVNRHAAVFPRPQNPLEVALRALERVNAFARRDGPRACLNKRRPRGAALY